MVRNIIFLLVFYFGLIFLLILFIPSFILPQYVVTLGGKYLGIWTGFCLKYIMGTKIEIKGIENISSKQKYFVASSHQSIFETFFLQTIFDKPVFILKKELTKIPLFGWYLKKMGCISIDRNKISKENLNFSNEVGKVIKDTDKILIIFPQGTRVPPMERPSFKKGASRIYEQLKINCLPIAINSGFVWPKGKFKNSNKTITISILKPIRYGLPKEDFLKILENEIYSELNSMN